MSRCLSDLPEPQRKLITDVIEDLNLNSINNTAETTLVAVGLLHKRLNLIHDYLLLDDKLQGEFTNTVFKAEPVRPKRPECKHYKNEVEVDTLNTKKSWWKFWGRK